MADFMKEGFLIKALFFAFFILQIVSKFYIMLQNIILKIYIGDVTFLTPNAKESKIILRHGIITFIENNIDALQFPIFETNQKLFKHHGSITFLHCKKDVNYAFNA